MNRQCQGYTTQIENVLNSAESDAVMKMQELARVEITEDISTLSREVLIGQHTNPLKNFRICLACKGDEIVGYGYCYENHAAFGDLLLIDTLYIIKEHRRNHLSELMLSELVQDVLPNKNSSALIEARTQENNVAANTLLTKLGFETRLDGSALGRLSGK